HEGVAVNRCLDAARRLKLKPTTPPGHCPKPAPREPRWQLHCTRRIATDCGSALCDLVPPNERQPAARAHVRVELLPPFLNLRYIVRIGRACQAGDQQKRGPTSLYGGVNHDELPPVEVRTLSRARAMSVVSQCANQQYAPSIPQPT